MKASYRDITSRIDEQPQWYDENGVPRYDKFHPDLLPDIYADECCLLLIACQACGRRFNVAMSESVMSRLLSPHKVDSLANRITKKVIHYGDPPSCCGVGSTMNSDDIKVIEYWERKKCEWKRKKKFEIKIEGA